MGWSGRGGGGGGEAGVDGVVEGWSSFFKIRCKQHFKNCLRGSGGLAALHLFKALTVGFGHGPQIGLVDLVEQDHLRTLPTAPAV